MARALLVETVHPSYATAVVSVMAQTPTYLIHGETSEMALGVPPRLRAMAAGSYTLEGTGHLMVLETPEKFAAPIGHIADDLSAKVVRGQGALHRKRHSERDQDRAVAMTGR